MLKFLQKKNISGFTLAEVLISAGIFVLVIGAISQVYLAVLRGERTGYNILTAENNIRNNVEMIARAIRMGRDFQLQDEGEQLCFNHFVASGETEQICYRFTNDNLKQRIGDQDELDLFDPNLRVTYGRFYVKQSSSSEQPTIIIVLEVTTTVKQQDYSLSVETAVTPRFLQLIGG